MDFHILDLIVYLLVCFIATKKYKEPLEYALFWFIFTATWIVFFVFPIDLNISDVSKIGEYINFKL